MSNSGDTNTSSHNQLARCKISFFSLLQLTVDFTQKILPIILNGIFNMVLSMYFTSVLIRLRLNVGYCILKATKLEKISLIIIDFSNLLFVNLVFALHI